MTTAADLLTVTLAPADLARLDAILACQPVRVVTLTAMPEVEEIGEDHPTAN